MSNTAITVLMTVYNGEKYLRQAIDSVLAQSHSNFEFLIVDDASTDSSLKIIQSYQDRRIRIIRNLINCGQTASLNIGLNEARGKYIARIDADDIAMPFWLAYQARFAEKYPKAAVISASAGVINKDGLVKQLLEIPQTHEAMLLRSLTASPVNHGGCLMNREVILRYGGYDAGFRVLADFDLWTRLLQGGEHFFSGKEVLMVVRFHSGSISKAEMEQLVTCETKKVFHSNILFFSGIELSERDQTLLWELCYRVEDMTLSDVEEAIVLLRTVYQRISIERVGRINVMNHWQRRIKVFAVKKIFVLLSVGDYKGGRAVCRIYKKYCGHSLMIVLFRYILSLGPLGKKIPLMFHFMRRQGAVLALKRGKLG
ncbi:MAG: glycosyltransferase [Candidatus Omnitrophica bacterium]|nr:glycosyltransferase [Candidatus Omnitrophota bacterium]